MPAPKTTNEVEVFLGKINYYGKFLPQLSTLCEPLNRFRRDEVDFEWSSMCEDSLKKDALSEATLLVHHDATKPLFLATDASNVGIGAVISHRDGSGIERPIAFASKTLTSAERNCSQIEKEALSIIFGVNKFYQYLAGRFTLITDHKPLVSIFSPDKSLPVYSLNRLQRYAMLLMSCWGFVITNWPEKKNLNNEFKPYFQIRDRLTVNSEILMNDTNVVIPTVLRHSVVEKLHESHLGIVKMKALARRYVWWLSISKELERFSRNCEACAKTPLIRQPTYHLGQFQKVCGSAVCRFM